MYTTVYIQVLFMKKLRVKAFVFTFLHLYSYDLDGYYIVQVSIQHNFDKYGPFVLYQLALSLQFCTCFDKPSLFCGFFLICFLIIFIFRILATPWSKVKCKVFVEFTYKNTIDCNLTQELKPNW